MVFRRALRLSALVVLVAVAAKAQTGPLADPIPAPIPQSPISIALKPIITGLRCPIDLTVAPGKNDRKFIVDETGLILVMKGSEVSPMPFLDITGIIAQLSPAFPSAPQGLNPGYDERGLLGLAFHPGFFDKQSPGFRTLYTLHNVPLGRQADFPQPVTPPVAIPNCQEVIAEWQVDHEDHDQISGASYREVLRFDRPEFNHNGGTLAFDSDGLLYAAFGDGGNANDVGPGHMPGTGNAQSLSTILGKMIRINPLNPRLTTNHDGALSNNGQYRIPKNNPFFTRFGAVREIYAYGFRNPFRFRFDPHGDQLVLADVGQNSIEEVDIITEGGNYGWNIQEGTFLFMATGPNAGTVFTNPHPAPGLVNPVVEYDHFEASANAITRIAIVGGYVYRGSKIPALKGRYVCADLNGFLFEANLNSGALKLLLNTGTFIKGIGQDGDNELYLTTSTIEGPGTTGSINGSVMRIVPPHGKN